MNLLSDIFYILCPIFIVVEVYQLLNKNKVYTKFNPNLDIKDTIPHFIFYLLRIRSESSERGLDLCLTGK